MDKEGDEPPNLGDCPKGFNAVAGVIKHEAYLGGSSTYEAEIAGGKVLAFHSFVI